MNPDQRQLLHTSAPPPSDDQKTEMTESEYEQALEIIEQEEKKFYRNNLSYQELITTIQDILKHKKHPRIESILNFYLGTKKHDYANINFIKFNSGLGTNTQKGLISRKEQAQAWKTYSEKDAILEQEQSAIDYYRKALKHCPHRTYLTPVAIETLLQDLEYRQIQRLTNTKQRQTAIADWEKKYMQIINDVEIRGKRDETIIVWLINQNLRKNGLDHLVHFYHALPEDDRRHKIDHILNFGQNIVNINFKSYSSSSYVQDFNNDLTHKERKKIQGTSIRFVQLDSQELDKIYSLNNQKKLSAKDKQTYTRLLNKLSHEILELLPEGDIIQNKKEKAKTKRKNKITKNILLEYFRKVPRLIKLGYLSVDDNNNYDKIIKAQQNLYKDLQNKDFCAKLTDNYKKMQNK